MEEQTTVVLRRCERAKGHGSVSLRPCANHMCGVRGGKAGESRGGRASVLGARRCFASRGSPKIVMPRA